MKRLKNLTIISLGSLIIITVMLSIILGCYYSVANNSIKDIDLQKTHIEILKDNFGTGIDSNGLITFGEKDDTWKYEYPGQIVLPYIKPSDAYAYSVVSPAIKDKLKENNLNLYYWVEYTCVYWDIKENMKDFLPEEEIQRIEDSYDICFQFYKANLLPLNHTMIVFGENEDSSNPKKIVGLWTKQQIEGFEKNQTIYNELYGYISLHFITEYNSNS